MPCYFVVLQHLCLSVRHCEPKKVTDYLSEMSRIDLERTWFEVRGSAILGGSEGSRFGFGGQS